MQQPSIFITQTKIQEQLLLAAITMSFVESAEISVRTLDNIVNTIPADDLVEFLERQKLQRRILIKQFDSKQDFREEIMQLFQKYEQPTLCFLGNLSEYSVQLQEGMLRLLEEPPKNLLLLLTCNQLNQVIPTISSRCHTHYLPSKTVLKLLDDGLLAEVKQKLPEIKETVGGLLQRRQVVSIKDFNQIERHHIHFWLWQILQYLEHIYTLKPQPAVGEVIYKVISAMKLNNDNVQKRFVFELLQVWV